MFPQASVSHSVGGYSHPPTDMPPPATNSLVAATIYIWSACGRCASYWKAFRLKSIIWTSKQFKNIFCGLNYHHIPVLCSITCFDRLHVQVSTLTLLFTQNIIHKPTKAKRKVVPKVQIINFQKTRRKSSYCRPFTLFFVTCFRSCVSLGVGITTVLALLEASQFFSAIFRESNEKI